jgi:hypothetical protein
VGEWKPSARHAREHVDRGVNRRLRCKNPS